ncbi:hypothetical protein D3C71_796280 [compost metagenome]
MLVRVALQVALKAHEALRQTLGVIQAIHADRQLAVTQAVAQVAHGRLVGAGLGLARDVVGIDADRERRGAEAAPAGGLQFAVCQHPAAPEQAHVGLEAIGIALGLEADQIVGIQAGEQAQVVRHGLQQVGRGHRHVQEEADPAADATLAQQRGQRDQVVIVDPDDVVFAQQRGQLFGEQRVDPAVGFAGGAVVVHQVQAEVQQRPQGAVGEAVVVAVDVALVEVHGHIADVVLHLLVEGAAVVADRFATPAEPDPATLLECGQQAHGQTAGARFAGHRDPVGHHDQAAHDASCQLRDRRIAAVIRPTCE